jgi:hypothetical protein
MLFSCGHIRIAENMGYYTAAITAPGFGLQLSYGLFPLLRINSFSACLNL